ncbi:MULTISPECIES: MlaC/ttg2D family ABC transporter substrate-binding protein [Roseobacteraceae]|jgi:phospholipid transport system substrate-binding protein|uniref:MlaC protein n=1 Tax=Pseudosulfitobacter pseudonitzschiae TaxID=1402135 RepID=A0A221K5C0_9RHOB|nr:MULTISPECIES: ABC transporter substrate-binding protein [Roseobacteraceae]ASM74208.1 MlaC protein [Pseudosulfitobacter pseudonitzschiae]
MLNNLTRRTFLAASGGALVAGPVWALNEAQARALVDKLVAEINRVIASGKSENAMIRDFEKIFATYGDVPIMAQYALGVDGRSASAAQKRKFGDVFAGYISRKYGKRFHEFIGGRIEVKSARQIKAGYEIKTTAYLRGEAPFEVTFLVSDKSGRNLFFNMFIEGVNMLLTERTEIGALLDRNGGNIDKMISDLSRMG